jgi:hypothetical protein
VHAAAGRDGHGRFERRRWEQEENEHLKLEKVDVPDGRRTLKIGALVQALDGTKGFPMTDAALEAGLKVPSNLVLGVIGCLRAAASIHPIIALLQELPRESFAYPFRMVRLEACSSIV